MRNYELGLYPAIVGTLPPLSALAPLAPLRPAPLSEAGRGDQEKKDD